MGKTDRPLAVEIPRPGSDQPAWSRVGAIGLAGFLIGIAWPRIAGVRIGPSVPGDLRAQIEATASPAGSAAPRASGAASAAPAPSGSAAAVPPSAGSADPAVSANQELVVVGAGKITKCFEKKDKKIEDCEKLLFDPIAVPRLKELSKCPSALGLEGKMTIGFEVNFDKKEVQVSKPKKVVGMPSTTVNGILQCAAHDFGNVTLDEVPHKFRRYTLAYTLNFYKPGKHPGAAENADGGDGDNAAGATTSETEATGNAVIASDSVSLRKEAKGKEKVGRLVRGTKVKILAKQNDWYKVESGSNVGWVYRTAIGL